MEGCKFYVGQKVRDHVLFPDLGVGTIEEIDRGVIGVTFDGEFRYYYLGGNYDLPNIPTLVPADEGFDLHIPAPEPEFKKGERVLMRDREESPWVGHIYGSFAGKGVERPFLTINGGAFRICRKWDESLIGKVTP